MVQGQRETHDAIHIADGPLKTLGQRRNRDSVDCLAVLALKGLVRTTVPRPMRHALFPFSYVQQTGLGTVSAAYDGTGAGVVFEPGAPGVAKFMNVDVKDDLRIVTRPQDSHRIPGPICEDRPVRFARSNRTD